MMERSLICLCIFAAVASSVANESGKSALNIRKQRSVNLPIVGSLFGRKKEEQIPSLNTHPLWKVHRYHGISLQPVSIPGEHIPSSLPIPPTLPGVAPSVVNVPGPYHSHHITLPSNEYGPPPSAPYPPAEPISAPYPPPVPPSAPYPASVPSGPYPKPTVPHPVIYNAQGHSSGAAFNSASTSFSESSGSSLYTPVNEFKNPPANAASEHSSINFYDLQTMLSPDLANKLQQYTSTPRGRERVSALIRIAANAQKLKTNAANSLQGMFQKLFGGAGGSANIALESGTYTSVPSVYPAPQGIFNNFKAVGTGVSGSLLPSLPEAPPLPKIPGLKKLPPTPGLPHINLPATDNPNLKETGGQYVSFNIPQGQQSVSEPHDLHAQTYGAPPAIPSTSYGTPIEPVFDPNPYWSGSNSDNYQNPHHSSSGGVSTSYELPQSAYGAPISESSGGDISTFFQRPSQTYGLGFDSFPAGSETEEEYQHRNSQVKGEVAEIISEPSKTTKLHKVQSSQPFQINDMKIYLDSSSQAPRQSYQGFQPVDQSQESNDIMKEEEH